MTVAFSEIEYYVLGRLFDRGHTPPNAPLISGEEIYLEISSDVDVERYETALVNLEKTGLVRTEQRIFQEQNIGQVTYYCISPRGVAWAIAYPDQIRDAAFHFGGEDALAHIAFVLGEAADTTTATATPTEAKDTEQQSSGTYGSGPYGSAPYGRGKRADQEASVEVPAEAASAWGSSWGGAPASDRVVPLSHNAPEYVQAVKSVEKLQELVRGNNEFAAAKPNEHSQIVSELSAIRELLEAQQVNVSRFETMAWGALGWLVAEFAGQPIGELAAVTWEALKALIGIG